MNLEFVIILLNFNIIIKDWLEKSQVNISNSISVLVVIIMLHLIEWTYNNSHICLLIIFVLIRWFWIYILNATIWAEVIWFTIILIPFDLSVHILEFEVFIDCITFSLVIIAGLGIVIHLISFKVIWSHWRTFCDNQTWKYAFYECCNICQADM